MKLILSLAALLLLGMAGEPVNKFCAVQKDEKIDPKVTYEYKGQTIGFCCADCIPEFKKDPEKYMKDLK